MVQFFFKYLEYYVLKKWKNERKEWSVLCWEWKQLTQNQSHTSQNYIKTLNAMALAFRRKPDASATTWNIFTWQVSTMFHFMPFHSTSFDSGSYHRNVNVIYPKVENPWQGKMSTFCTSTNLLNRQLLVHINSFPNELK